MTLQLASQPQGAERIEKQKRKLIKAMRGCIQSIFAADFLFEDILNLLSDDQLDALEDLLVNHYGAED